MLVAVTGCTDAFWRQSAWYLNIQVEQLPKIGREKKEKMEKIIVRMEKFIVRMEKIILKWRKLLHIPGRIGAATLRP
jgi:hypothetical protein